MMYDELIQNLRNCSDINSLSRYKRDLMKQAADAIEELQRRKHGKWEAASEDLIICTSCKCGFLLSYPNRIEEAKTVYGWNFCPNCGADTRGYSNV